ncbi:hypothetical protein [Candidatus Uabimicrobium sp. HlEnr_7]|uniref:hypothetical protein n=1 Tax=Candidatus Uabimicrobium helgolandensis TaxID=3095367 RepID=UPI003556806C
MMKYILSFICIFLTLILTNCENSTKKIKTKEVRDKSTKEKKQTSADDTDICLEDDYKKKQSDPEKYIRSILNSVDITLDFTDVSFAYVIYFIQKTVDINIHVDSKVNQTFEVEGTKVTLDVKELKLKTVLDLLMQFYNLEYLYKKDFLFITFKNSKSIIQPMQSEFTTRIDDFPGPVVSIKRRND